MAGSFRGKSSSSQPENANDRQARLVSPAEAARRTTSGSLMISHASRTIRSDNAPFRWECPCQTPGVLLATYHPGGKINIKIRDRYWHLYGFGMVQAVCPRCAAEHMLDLRQLADAMESAPESDRNHVT